MAKTPPEPRPLRQRLMWFVLLYGAGLAVTAAVVYGLRAIVFL